MATKVTSRVLAADAIVRASLGDDAVGSAEIADDAITSALVADDIALGGNPTTTTQSTANSSTRIATTAFVQSAIDTDINALIDSAPGTLNTLDEIAAALNDDPSFTTTVNNAIALKAPIANPVFTGNATFDSPTLYVDGSNDRVGIGTTSPGAKLHIEVADGAEFLKVTQTGNEHWAFKAASGAGSTDYISVGISGGTQAMTWQEDGKIGIGVAAPVNKLEVDGGSAAVRLRISTTGEDAQEAGLILANSSKSAYNDGITMSHGAGYTRFDGLDGQEIMRLMPQDGAAGNVSVAGTLGVTGTSTFGGGTSITNAGVLTLEAGGNLTTASGNDLNIVYPSNRSLFIKEGSTTSVTIDNAQKVTLAGALDANGIVTVANAANTDGLLVTSPASSGGTGIQIKRLDSNTDQQVGRIQFGNNTDLDIAAITAKTDGANDSGALMFNTQTASGSLAERIRIGSAGQLGIAGANYGSDGQVLTSTGTSTAPAWETASGGTIASASDCTISSSDPADDSNPSAVGHLWINSSSGESFICTDATTDQNDWTNVGDGTGSLNYTAATGGTITQAGGYKYHTFTSSGNFAVTGTSLACEWAIIAGGGSGARSPNIGTGGGGAGGFIDSSGTLSPATYAVVIGGGGASFSAGDGGGNNGSNSTFNSLTAIGGGTSGFYSGNSMSPAQYVSATAGGSGGGASWNGGNNTTEGAGTSGQGNAGGPSGTPGDNYAGNGGGGKGAQGGDVVSSTVGGNGGIGLDWKSLGTYYAGGGGGAPGGTGGNGGGATAIDNNSPGTQTGQPGTVNTGGGGSGAKATGYSTHPSHPSGAGGSGIVIIRYQV